MTAYILDTETTGLNEPHMTELAYSIIDIGDSKVFVMQEPRSKRYNPCKPIELGSMATSHITDEDVANEPPHTDFRLPESVQYLIGHNVDYDIAVLKHAGITQEPKLICTKAMACHLLPELDSHKLTALLYHFHREIARAEAKDAHAAVIDIYFTQLVLQSLIDEAIKQGHSISDIESLYQFSELARVPTHMPWGKYKGEAISSLALDDPGYLRWVISNTDDEYLVKACWQALEA